jgi:hypothetical protein
MRRELVLITGASSGIGLELAKLFAADGSDLILVARNRQNLENLAAELQDQHRIWARVLTKDLAAPAAPSETFDELKRDGLAVDVLVNNAGFGARGRIADIDVQRQLDMIQVNITALTHLTRLFLPGMIERRRGGILNVGSTAGFQPGPNMSVYYATKSYVLFFTEGLAEELIGTGVKACCLAPGPTHTGFSAAADMEATPLFKMGAMSAEKVARIGYKGFRAGRVLVIPGVRNKMGPWLVRFSPRAAVRKITKRLHA